MVKFLVGLATLASIAFADITFNCIGYPAPGNSIGVSINGVITKLAALENTAPVWTGVVPGATSAVQYSYVEINAANTPVKTEAFVRKLNQTTDIATDNEFFDRPITHHVVPRLPYTYLATYPSKSKAFKETQIATLHLTGDKPAIDKLNASPETDGAEVRVNFRFINAKTIYSQRNITLKTSGKSSKEFAKQSYKIKFDTDFNQTFFSRPNLKLRSMATEPTYLREKLYIDTLNAVGVPTQQGSYVRLFINNEPYGLYLMVDDIKKSFAKQTVHGGDDLIIPGSLIQANAPTLSEQADLAYKGPLSAAYGKETYISQNLGNNLVTEPLSQLITLMKDLQDFDPVATPDPLVYWNNRIDLDGFLRNMALEYLFGGFDNYWMAGSNYFIYFNPTLGTSGKWQWLPTDFDGTFGNGAEIDPLGSYKTLYNFTPDHPLVSKLIIKNAAINALFNTIIKEIVSTTFKPEAMNPHIEALNKMISLDAAWDFTLPRKSPGKNPGFTFDDFNNNLVNITKDMSGAIKPWIAARANTTSVELQFTIPAGTADRVPPPPRKGGNGDDDDDASPEGGNASSDGVSVRAVGSVMVVVAMVASSLLLA
ncbi:hypothetical protein BGZ95_009236 [Linnemannia exigua]|uniref:Coth-domain-containing protein n=1 Tax=Linnemannia exigua TaxID=604196 RepID=A0AAD4DD62_9FUNG|nr:hypothetical protein BGZ95_009236 [Linnemannia exigua]